MGVRHRAKSLAFFSMWTVLLLLLALDRSNADELNAEERPLVFLSFLARNQAHTLRNTLGYIERLDYPKDRIAVW